MRSGEALQAMMDTTQASEEEAPSRKTKKIDDWTVRVQGGKKLKISVLMHVEHGVTSFGLECDHPEFNLSHLVDHDINKLRQALDLHVKKVISVKVAEGWSEGRILEVRHRPSEAPLSGRKGFALEIQMSPVEVLGVNRSGNTLIAQVRNKWKSWRVALRGHREDFSDLKPNKAFLGDPSVKKWNENPLSSDPINGLGRTVTCTPDRAEEALVSTLNRFGVLLTERMSPDRTDVSGFIRIEELVKLMDEAVKGEKDATK